MRPPSDAPPCLLELTLSRSNGGPGASSPPPAQPVPLLLATLSALFRLDKTLPLSRPQSPHLSNGQKPLAEQGQRGTQSRPFPPLLFSAFPWAVTHPPTRALVQPPGSCPHPPPSPGNPWLPRATQQNPHSLDPAGLLSGRSPCLSLGKEPESSRPQPPRDSQLSNPAQV